jgi:rod shape-determining protein MreD
VQGILIVVLTAIFGNDPARPRALAVLVMPHAVATSLVAPFVFSLAERLHAATITVPRPGEGGPR